MKNASALPKNVAQHTSDFGYRLRARLPWIDVREHGWARGVIAIGPSAIGIFAFGGWAIGIFAFGGSAVGVFALGCLSAGVFREENFGRELFGPPGNWSVYGVPALALLMIAISAFAVLQYRKRRADWLIEG